MHPVHVDPLLIAMLPVTYPPARAVSGNLPRLSPLLTVEHASGGGAQFVARDEANQDLEYVSPPMSASVLSSEEGLLALGDFMHKLMVAPFN